MRLLYITVALLALGRSVAQDDEDYGGGGEDDYGGGGDEGYGGGDEGEGGGGAPEAGATRELLSVADFEAFLDDTDASVVGTFTVKRMPDPEATVPEGWDEDEDGPWAAPEIDNPALTAFNSITSALYGYRFAFTTEPEVLAHMKAKSNGLYLYRSPKFVSKEHGDRPRERFPSGKLTDSAVSNWLSAKAQPLVGLYSSSTKDRYSKDATIVIFLNLDFETNPKGVNYALKRARKAALNLKGQLRVAVASLSESSYELGAFGLASKSTADVLMGIVDGTGAHYAPKAEGGFSAAALAEFARAYSANELEPYIAPPPPPQSDEGYGGDEDGGDYGGDDAEGMDDELKDEA